MEHKQFVCPKPWIGVTAEEKENTVTLKVLGRTYEMNHAVLPTSIVSLGEELLYSPMRLVCRECGQDTQWQDPQVYLMEESTEETAVLCATMAGRQFYINTALRVDYDGCMDIDIKIMPRGTTVQENYFGLKEEDPYRLDRLWLEIPLKKEHINLFEMFPRNDYTLCDGTVVEGNGMTGGDFIPEGLTKFSFQPQMILCGDGRGIGCFFESNQNWQPEDPADAMELEDRGDHVVFRVRLLDSNPASWKYTEREAAVWNNRPVCFRMGLQVLPYRTFPKNPYKEHNIHIDCFTKIQEDYEDFLAKPYCDENGVITDATVFDRLKRLGVNALYLHEKWNTCQNAFSITKAAGRRLHYIVEQCHSRGIRVIPYFGFEISTLHPDWSKVKDEYCTYRPDGEVNISWNRKPYQRTATVCQSSGWSEEFVRGIDRLFAEYGFDGLYLDGTASPKVIGCSNENHGCGYRDGEGKIHATYPFFGIRRLMKQLYQVAEKHGATICCHTNAVYTVASMPFCHCIWDGEVLQSKLVLEGMERMPEGLFRSNFPQRAFGLPMFMLVYPNPPVWTFEQGMAVSLLLGVLPKPVDVGKPLEQVSRLWHILDKYPVENAQWCPYWQEQTLLQSSHSAVKLSYFYCESEKRLLVFAVNTTNQPIDQWTMSAEGTMYSLLDEGADKCAKQITERLEGLSYRVYMVHLF